MRADHCQGVCGNEELRVRFPARQEEGPWLANKDAVLPRRLAPSSPSWPQTEAWQLQTQGLLHGLDPSASCLYSTWPTLNWGRKTCKTLFLPGRPGLSFPRAPPPHTPTFRVSFSLCVSACVCFLPTNKSLSLPAGSACCVWDFPHGYLLHLRFFSPCLNSLTDRENEPDQDP